MSHIKQKAPIVLLLILFIINLQSSPSLGKEASFPLASDFDYASWISADPKEKIGEFENACRAVETYLNSINKEFYGEKCVSDLYTGATFIHNTNAFIKTVNEGSQQMTANRDAAIARFKKVLNQVIDKAIVEGKATTRKENINLIYTVIVTVSRDIVADYYHNVIGDPEEAKAGYLLAGTEDGKRIYRQGEYRAIYEQLDKK